eukprot:m.356367 g.356367  ORF g.356367 m.356367 type:complete len:88 (-) comp55953_c0_seq3:2071-2334(-)
MIKRRRNKQTTNELRKGTNITKQKTHQLESVVVVVEGVVVGELVAGSADVEGVDGLSAVSAVLDVGEEIAVNKEEPMRCGTGTNGPE